MNWGGWLLAGAFTAISFAVSLIACALVMRSGVVDAPDGARKQQKTAIPRLGGVAILAGTLIGTVFSLGLFFLTQGIEPVTSLFWLLMGMIEAGQGLTLAFAFIAIAFCIGLWDDLAVANTKLKLLLLIAACLGLATLGLRVDQFATPFGDLDVALVLTLGSAVWLLVFVNAANFMDGSNGLSIGCLCIMLIGLAVIGAMHGDWSLSLWWFPLFGSIAGFLMQNLRGHLYAGDAGALGLGAVFAGMGLVSGLEVWTIATLALPFLLDVLLTLIWRARQGRNWLDAHLDHAYQRLIAHGWTHLETAVLYWGLTVVAAVLAYIAAQAGGAAPFLVFWTLTLTGSGLWLIHRRDAKLSDLSD